MKAWSCIENCGACCKFDLDERSDLVNKLSNEDLALINSMTSKDGWCKNLDKKTKKCLIYDNRPHFCKVFEFSMTFKGYKKLGDSFLIDCCKQHIKSNYGKESPQMKNFRIAIKTK
tara:strand:+ start:167 stop:514 length:348 start_codon:yes stop_codon:yes gene_type:complete